ncbi:DUF369 domain-containing protein TM1367 [Olavius algarvensis associated proteobacterium Delta 3]|nr:DUF369 domain-containing protein TM1367 [Olavius algarvensis associated proteobacterium Delta 3]CAB5098024.1 DUF369 domain-containing protein TM1367 [Olavius algarvensis associated proteobacterium Delta 3]
MSEIRISAGNIAVSAVLMDTPTANQIEAAMPLEGTANVWGDEIYFDVPIQMDLETDARQEVAVGDLGYWPMGSAFCIFFGPTPVSTGANPKAYSPVNVFGRVSGDASVLKQVSQGTPVRVERV